jgi:hypothetical protein
MERRMFVFMITTQFRTVFALSASPHRAEGTKSGKGPHRTQPFFLHALEDPAAQKCAQERA